jgi:hypothetical protein
MRSLIRFVLKITVKVLSQIARLPYYVMDVLAIVKKIYFDFDHRSDDIFIVTYPKSGTTWMQAILYEIVHRSNQDFGHISQVSPFFETRFGTILLKSLKSPRIIKSHLHQWQIPSGNGKYFYVIRNPADMLVSHYHHDRAFNNYNETFENFFDSYRKGKLYKGSWGRHVAGWLKNRKKLNVLHVYYEDLKMNLPEEIRRIADFCQIDLGLSIDDILHAVSFDNMKEKQDKCDYYFEKLNQTGWIKGRHIRTGHTQDADDYIDVTKRRVLYSEIEKSFSKPGMEKYYEVIKSYLEVPLTSLPQVSSDTSA